MVSQTKENISPTESIYWKEKKSPRKKIQLPHNTFNLIPTGELEDHHLTGLTGTNLELLGFKFC